MLCQQNKISLLGVKTKQKNNFFSEAMRDVSFSRFTLDTKANNTGGFVGVFEGHSYV